MRKPHRTDLTDAQWKIAKPSIPPPKPGGRPRATDMREVLNILLHQARTGCQWGLPPKRNVWGYFAQWRVDGTWERITDALRRKVRAAEGRDPTPRVGYIDSRTVKGTEVGGERGYDGGKMVTGRKRLRFPRPETVWGDGMHRNRELDAWLGRTRPRSRVEVVRRPEGSEGFVKLPKRWVSERTFAWRGRYRRHSEDYEWKPESSEAWVRVSSIGQMLRQLERFSFESGG